MIDGITVLSQQDITYTPTWFLIVSIFVLAATIAMLALAFADDNAWFLIGGLILIVGFVVLIYMNIFDVFTYDSGRDEYKCLIQEDVSMTEILNRFEVVGQDGQIWILEDKE